jgi:choline dehydrogenase-like flavoprotein
MIHDLEQLGDRTDAAFDLCVVGAGPAGITIADELRGSGLKVCLVESGGLQEEATARDLLLGESVGHPMALDHGRHRVLGGAATRWGGRSATLDPIDLQYRDWVKNSGWPIDYAHLGPYYERAKQASNFKDPWVSFEQVQRSLGIRLPTLASGDLDPFVWRVASPDWEPTLQSYLSLGYRSVFDWGKVYRARLAADVDTFVLLHANLTKFHETDDGARVEAITVRSLGGKSMTIRAKAFALCCGGIENVRLLLNAPPRLLNRINQFDRLGRYFSQHPRGCIATIDADEASAKALQHLYNTFLRPLRDGEVQYETGFAISERAQREHQLLNASAAIYYNARPDTVWEASRRMRDAIKSGNVDRSTFRDLQHALGGVAAEIPNIARRFVLGRPVIHRDPLISICIDLEQEPDPESRVTLSAERDALGMRRAKVDWRIAEKERRTARYFGKFVASELERLGFGRVRQADWLSRSDAISVDDLRGTYHFLSGTRMSRHPRDGVVDENCRAHGAENLYLAGTSVFTTGGHANPTLTIVALAIRLADHLRAELRNRATAHGRVPTLAAVAAAE